MLAVTGSEHGNSDLQLVYRVVGEVVVYRTGMLAVTGSEHRNSYSQLVYGVVGVMVVYRTGMLAFWGSNVLINCFMIFVVLTFCFLSFLFSSSLE